jgi:hypothetical protein
LVHLLLREAHIQQGGGDVGDCFDGGDGCDSFLVVAIVVLVVV